MYMCRFYVWVCRVREAREGVRSPGAGVTGNCELPELRSSARAVLAFNP